MAKINEDELLDKINKLDRELTALRDEYVKYRRQQEDLMYNLDDDNLSTVYKQGMDGRFTKIEVDADGIRTEVQRIDGDVDDIATNVSNIEQSATTISTQVSMMFDRAYQSPDDPLGQGGDPEELERYKGRLVTFTPQGATEASYYYFNAIENKWKVAQRDADSGGIASQFKQTADGFILKGTTKIDGNTILNGNTLQNGTFISADNEGLDTGMKVCIKDGALYIDSDVDAEHPVFKLGYNDVTSQSIVMELKNGWTLYTSGDIRIPAVFG